MCSRDHGARRPGRNRASALRPRAQRRENRQMPGQSKGHRRAKTNPRCAPSPPCESIMLIVAAAPTRGLLHPRCRSMPAAIRRRNATRLGQRIQRCARGARDPAGQLLSRGELSSVRSDEPPRQANLAWVSQNSADRNQGTPINPVRCPPGICKRPRIVPGPAGSRGRPPAHAPEPSGLQASGAAPNSQDLRSYLGAPCASITRNPTKRAPPSSTAAAGHSTDSWISAQPGAPTRSPSQPAISGPKPSPHGTRWRQEHGPSAAT